MNAVLVEADRVGRGDTDGVRRMDFRGSRRRVCRSRETLGVRGARHAFQAWRRAALDFSALLRRLDIQCHLEPHSALTVAFTPEQIARLKKEQKARLDAGLSAPALGARAVSAEVALARRVALARPRRRDDRSVSSVLGLAKAAAERGARSFERSPMKRITFNRKTADVHTAGGAIHAQRVIVATAMPSGVLPVARASFLVPHAYMALTEPVPAKMRREQFGKRTTVVRDSADRRTRPLAGRRAAARGRG